MAFTLKVSDQVRDSFPELRLAILLAIGINNEGAHPQLEEKKEAAARRFHDEWTNEALTEQPEIQAWRSAYREFGVKYKSSRPTAEAFLRRLIKGEDFPTISKAVDSYLLTETEYFLPVGGYDLDTLTGDVVLRTSAGGEQFTPLGSPEATEVTRVDEVVYADNARILTRKWNFRDCDHCKITPSSTNIVLVTEAPFETVTTDHLDSSIKHMAQTVKDHCGGEIKTLVSAAKPEIMV